MNETWAVGQVAADPSHGKANCPLGKYGRVQAAAQLLLNVAAPHAAQTHGETRRSSAAAVLSTSRQRRQILEAGAGGTALSYPWKTYSRPAGRRWSDRCWGSAVDDSHWWRLSDDRKHKPPLALAAAPIPRWSGRRLASHRPQRTRGRSWGAPRCPSPSWAAWQGRPSSHRLSVGRNSSGAGLEWLSMVAEMSWAAAKALQLLTPMFEWQVLVS